MEFILRGNIPSKKNSRINTRSGRSFPSKAYTQWHEIACWQLKRLKTIDYRIKIDYIFTPKDKRKFDVSNKIESINDLLVDMGIIKDDNYIFLLIGDTEVLKENKENCGCKCIIHKIESYETNTTSNEKSNKL